MFLPPTDKQNCGEGTTKHSVAYRARICTQLLQVEKIHLRLAVIAPHYRAEERGYVTDSDCNPGIPAVFANPEYRDWQRPNPWISGLQKFVKVALFRASKDKNSNSRVQTLAGCYDMARNELFIQLIYLQFKPLMAMTTNAKIKVLR